MLRSSRPSAVCCRTASQLFASRASSSSASSEAPTAQQAQRSASAKGWQVRKRVIKAAVYGHEEVEEQLGSPQAGPSTSRSTYLQQGFRPTSSRGQPRMAVKPRNLEEARQQKKEADQHRFYVQRSVYQKRLRRRSSSPTRSFSTSAASSLQDDRLNLPSTSTSPSFRPRNGKGPRITPSPFSTDDFAANELDVLDILEGPTSSEAAGKGKARGVLADVPQFGSLVPGCWIESRRNGVPLEGILCGRSPGDPREVLVLSPSANGESALLGVATEDITFVLPSFTSSAEATQCLNLPPGHPTIHQLLQKLRHLEIRVEEHTRRLVNRGAKDLYRQIQQPSKWRTYTDTTAALQRLGETRAIAETHLALHRILINDPLHFVADPIAMRTSGKFLLRSQQELELFVRVRGWVRDHSEELQSFAEKAAQARLFGAKDPPTLAGAKSNPTPLSRHEVPSSFDWTGTDRDILLFLRRTLTNERALQVHPYMAIAPSIIKAADEAMLALGGTNPYSGLDVGRLRMQAFLAEVGVVAPWEDWVVHDTDNFFHSWESVSRELLRNSREFSPPAASPKQVEQSEESSPAPLAEESSATSTFDPSFLWAPSESSHHPLATRPVKSGYYAADAFDSVRHDFNHLPVYTIDDAGAMELDDGISIVQAPSRTSTDPPSWWVHVHVADPTANLEPSHPLAMAARIRDHSEYFPERTWSMLPDWFIKEQGMSLGSQEGREQRTLSISMRVDNSGEVLESDVKVGIIRNVKRLTYSTVNKVLGAAERPTETTLTHPIIRSTFHQARLSVGRQHRETDDASLPSDSTSIDDLKTLRRLAAAMLQRRANDNALYWSFPSASVAVTPKLGHAFSVSTRPIFYKEAPLVTLTLPSLSNVSQSALSPAQLLVSEMMVAANRAAARFSVERGLPAPFRTQAAPVLSPSVLQEVLDARDPKTGEANGEDILRLGVDFLPGSTSVEPGPHWPMGVNDDFGYLRVTSPLRRYSDLFTHWQLKSALLPSSSGSSAPHFTRSAVLQHIEGFDLAHKARGRLSKHAEHYWALYVLKHKLDALSADPSSADVDPVASLLLRDQPLSALSLRDPSFSVVDGIWVQPVLVRELGVRATLYSDKQVDAPEKGEVLLVGVEDIKLGPRSKMAVRRRW